MLLTVEDKLRDKNKVGSQNKDLALGRGPTTSSLRQTDTDT